MFKVELFEHSHIQNVKISNRINMKAQFLRILLKKFLDHKMIKIALKVILNDKIFYTLTVTNKSLPKIFIALTKHFYSLKSTKHAFLFEYKEFSINFFY